MKTDTIPELLKKAANIAAASGHHTDMTELKVPLFYREIDTDIIYVATFEDEPVNLKVGLLQIYPTGEGTTRLVFLTSLKTKFKRITLKEMNDLALENPSLLKVLQEIKTVFDIKTMVYFDKAARNREAFEALAKIW